MQSPSRANLAASLSRLGFSEMEANIYVDLLPNPGSTGYRIGKSINKPHANVYQGLVALEQKGAVTFEEGASKTYSAVPPQELLRQLRRRYDQDCLAAEQALQGIDAPRPEEDRFHRLTTLDQVYARARTMLEQAEETILVYARPAAVAELRADLRQAVERGVAVAGLVFREEDRIDGSKLTLSRVAGSLGHKTQGEQLYIATDAREFMIVQSKTDPGELRAVWMSSAFVGAVFHNGLVSDIILHNLPAVEDIESPNEHLLGLIPTAVREFIRR